MKWSFELLFILFYRIVTICTKTVRKIVLDLENPSNHVRFKALMFLYRFSAIPGHPIYNIQ